MKCCDGEEFPADYVIITVSLGVLKHQHDKLFCPALPAEKVEAICKLGYGYVNKIFLEYARPFWVWKEGGLKLAWSADELADRCDWVKGTVSKVIVNNSISSVARRIEREIFFSSQSTIFYILSQKKELFRYFFLSFFFQTPVTWIFSQEFQTWKNYRLPSTFYARGFAAERRPIWNCAPTRKWSSQ